MSANKINFLRSRRACNYSQPSSERIVAYAVPSMAPETILPARFWILSRRVLSPSDILSKATSPYSTIGRIYDIYNISRIFQFNLKRSASSWHSLLSARAFMSSTWLFHFRSEENVRPRCLWTLKVTSHCLDQLSIRTRSLSRTSLLVLCKLKTIYNKLSSANKLILFSNPSLISSINIRNNRGPRTDPCRTPASIVPYSEEWPFITTHCFLSVRWSENHSFREPVILLFYNLCSIPSCHARSKALKISAKTKRTFFYYPRPRRKHGINVQVDVLCCALA